MMQRSITTLIAAAVLLTALSGCGPGANGSAIKDYMTMRSVSGALTTRDVKPEPRPREAITGDDYFQIKLEHIYMGSEMGQGVEVGNIAIISQVSGVFPDGVTCQLLDTSDAGVDLIARQRNNQPEAVSCDFKSILAIDPVFADGHVTFDSVFITPPFRMGRREIGLRFLMVKLNDVEMARKIVRWAEDKINTLGQLGLGEFKLTAWQSELVNVGFTVANHILDYLSEPTYLFEFETDFVPIESVGGVDTPQNLFMGGDFIIVGVPRAADNEQISASLSGDAAPVGALAAAERLVFDSGRLYHRDSRAEYRDGAYIIFKVVRQSRYPRELPVALARINREIERGASPDELDQLSRGAVLDLQDARILNETEGRYLLDAIKLLVEGRQLETRLEAAVDGARPEPSEWPLALRAAPASLGPDLSLVTLLDQASQQMTTLEVRLYENFGATPGIWQEECVVFRDVTQRTADSYNRLHPLLQRSFEDLQIRRSQLARVNPRSPAEEQELAALKDAELWLASRLKALPETLAEPACPGIRQ